MEIIIINYVLEHLDFSEEFLSTVSKGLEIFKSNFRQLLWRDKKKYFLAIDSWLEQVV